MEEEDINISELIRKYEEMLGQDKSIYFDTDEIDAIAFSYELKDDFNEALNAVNYGLTLHPENSTLLLCKAKYLLFLDYTEEARKIMSNIPPINSDEATLIRIELLFAEGSTEKAFAMIKEQMAKSKIDCGFCMNVINILWGYATFAEIIEFTNNALMKLPENIELLTELGTIYQDNQEYEKALEVFHRILDIDPYQTAIWLEQAKAFAMQREYDKAIESCDFALAIEENIPELLSFKGYCQYDANDYLAALATFKEYELLCEEKSIAYELIAECYSKLEMTQQSIEYLQKSLELKPTNLNTIYQLAYAYMDMGNTPMSKATILKGIELNGAEPDYHALLAELLLNERNFEEALVHLKRTYELDPERQNILLNLGDLSENLNLFNDAIHYFELALTQNRYDIKVLFRLILCYYANGDQPKALQLAKEVVEMVRISEFSSDLSEQEKIELQSARDVLNSLKHLLSDNLQTELE